MKTRPGAIAAVRGGREADDQHAGPRDHRSREPAGPSTPRRGTRPASRGRPPRATRPAAGTPGTPRSPRGQRARDRQTAGRATRRASLRTAPPLPSGGAGLLLVNATASSVTARKRVMIRKLLAAQHDVEVAETSRRGHATRLAHAAANDGFDVVVVLAGDGTLNEAADGLLHTDTALAPLPGGSTNVYARTLGFSTDAIDATERAPAFARARRDETHRRGPREPAAVPVQHRHRLRRRGDPPRRALRRAEAPLLAPAPRRGRPSRPSSARRERAPGSTSSSTRAR